MSSSAISVQSVSKLYRLQHAAAGSQSFRDLLTGLATAPFKRFRELSGNDRSLEDFWALKDVSFDVREGEVVGIIGRNGAGKSTLLKILSRIVEPTSGEVRMRGRVASLLEVGTGFHPELSGRENIYLNGSILGMKRREIDARFDEIVEFAEIEKFLDTPVKRYSSGMYVRLAFAVAAHLDPEILIVDEVLAVGDSEFQKKCLGKMKQVSTSGTRTVLFVSHNMAAVSTLCTRSVWLQNGKVVADGTSDKVIAQYLEPSPRAGPPDSFDLTKHPSRSSSQRVLFKSLRIFDKDRQAIRVAVPEQEIQLEMLMNFGNDTRSPRVAVALNNLRGDRVFVVATYLSPTSIERVRSIESVSVTFRLPALRPGTYSVDLSAADDDGKFLDQVEAAGTLEIAENGYLGSSYPHFPEMGSVLVRSAWKVVT